MPRLSLPIILVLGLLIVVKLPSNSYYPILFFGLTFIFHFNRKDIKFLKKAFVKNWKLVIFIENTLIYCFLLFTNINYKIDFFGIALIFSLIIFSFLYPKAKPDLSLTWNLIPNYLFEWKGFLRKNSWSSILVILLITASAYKSAILILVGIFVLDFIFNIFEFNESKEMLEMYFKKYNLKFKIRKNLLFFNLLLLPTYLLFLILNYNESIYLIFYMIFMNLYFLLVLTRKYKLYNHKEKINFYNMGVSLQYFFCSLTIIPAIFLLKENISSAKENLKNYVGN